MLLLGVALCDLGVQQTRARNRLLAKTMHNIVLGILEVLQIDVLWVKKTQLRIFADGGELRQSYADRAYRSLRRVPVRFVQRHRVRYHLVRYKRSAGKANLARDVCQILVAQIYADNATLQFLLAGAVRNHFAKYQKRLLHFNIVGQIVLGRHAVADTLYAVSMVDVLNGRHIVAVCKRVQRKSVLAKQRF